LTHGPFLILAKPIAKSQLIESVSAALSFKGENS
jgi:hypothetical protein